MLDLKKRLYENRYYALNLKKNEYKISICAQIILRKRLKPVFNKKNIVIPKK